jgi:protein gp37
MAGTKIEYVLDIKEKCQKANVAFYFKQWGRTNKKKAGKTLEGKIYKEMPLVTNEIG